jgi:predicted nucleotidyltransferase
MTASRGWQPGQAAVVDPKERRPAEWPPLDAEALLRSLAEGGVDFVVIGGIALVLQGSARLTRDLDIVFASDPAHLDALGEVLVEVDARLREVDGEVPFIPDARTLGNVELLTLTTSSGWLDVHRRVPGIADYESVRERAERMDLDGVSVLVASLDDLIAMKRAAGRARDLADVGELEAIKGLRRRTHE